MPEPSRQGPDAVLQNAVSLTSASGPLVAGAVLTPHSEARAAAEGVLKSGGNAVDAAVAAMMAACVVLPASVGFGGYGGSLVFYRARDGQVFSLDFDSRAPLAFTPEGFTEQNVNYGYLAFGVPGVVAGLDLALKTFGTLPWRTVAEHAVHVAEDGIPVDAALSAGFTALAERADASTLRALFPNGKAPAKGERWVQRDLARVIRAIGELGPDAFYRGDIARTIVRQVRANGGILAEEDFRRYEATVTEPIQVDYRGYTIYSPPPPSGGITSLCIVKTLENFDVGTLEPWGGRYFYLFAEAAKLCWQERFQVVGDPERVKFSVADLLSAKRAAERADKIRQGRTLAQVDPIGPGGQHTANVVIADRERNMVSLTATQGSGFGAHVAIEGLGLLLGNGMSRFAFTPESPNYPAPAKRMHHNMSPSLILRDGKPWAALGLPGGRMIVTVTAQLIHSLIDFHATPAQAVTAPRVHTEGKEPLLLSDAVSQEAEEDLRAFGHQLERHEVAGASHVALLSDEGRRIAAAAGSGPGGSDGVSVL